MLDYHKQGKTAISCGLWLSVCAATYLVSDIPVDQSPSLGKDTRAPTVHGVRRSPRISKLSAFHCVIFAHVESKVGNTTRVQRINFCRDALFRRLGAVVDTKEDKLRQGMRPPCRFNGPCAIFGGSVFGGAEISACKDMTEEQGSLRDKEAGSDKGLDLFPG